MLAYIQEHPFLCLHASFLKFQNIIVLNLFAHPYHRYGQRASEMALKAPS